MTPTRLAATLLIVLLALVAIRPDVGLQLTFPHDVATPRPAPDSDQGRLGAPLGTSRTNPMSLIPTSVVGQPVAETFGPTTPAPLDAVTRQGIGTHMGDSPAAGPLYLALPMGPGYRVRICGVSACLSVTSTDAGPEKWLQKPPHNIIADLSTELFERLCGCLASRGKANVTWTVEERPR